MPSPPVAEQSELNLFESYHHKPIQIKAEAPKKLRTTHVVRGIEYHCQQTCKTKKGKHGHP